MEGVCHEVSRATIFESVTTLFAECDTILNEIPLRSRFKGEKKIDVGGVSREMFSAFFEAVYAKYFDGAGLLCPVVSPHVKVSDLRLLGRIISCAYLSTNVLPMRIAFPCLSAMLLPNCGKLPDHILIDARKNSISIQVFPPATQTRLVNVLSNFECQELPKPHSFKSMIIDIATYHFLRKPSAVLADIHAGVPSIHLPF